MSKVNKGLIFILSVLSVASCGQKNPKHQYHEITIKSPLRSNPPIPDPHQFLTSKAGSIVPKMEMPDDETHKMINASVSKVSLVWKIPQGWFQSKGEGMRLVTFKTREEDPIECSIVLLGGMAGGLEANVIRWMGQINLTDISEDKVSQFIQDHEELTSDGGLEIKVFDFTKLQNDKPSMTQSMIAAIVAIKDQSVFVKMTGTKNAMSTNRASFNELCRSLKTPDE